MYRNENIDKMLKVHGFKKPYCATNAIGGASYDFDVDFILILDRYLAGEVFEISRSHQQFINGYLKWADEDGNNNLAFKNLDSLLFGVVESLDPNSQAVDEIFKEVDFKAEAISIVEALGSLEKLKSDTQSIVDDGVALAIEKAKKTALILS